MPKSHGPKRKSRSILTKSKISHGISYLLINYKAGDKVIIDIDPREHNTMPHRRFQGKVGTITEVGKRILKIIIFAGSKKKTLQTRPNHVRPLHNDEKISQ
jgi:large subunit ribosomal protein L21e